MPARNIRAPRRPETEPLTAIREYLEEHGPLSLAAFMNLALNHPEHGYYNKRAPFGADGDFVTAPEISQMFGELIGLWLATAWQEAGRPKPFRLVELGPGSGQLMADMVRATARVPGFLDHADLHLIESSARLQKLQRQKLPDLGITWHETLASVPGGPLFLIANEFFDVLPAHQLVRTPGGWAERLVAIGDEGLTFSEAEAPKTLRDMLPSEGSPDIGEIAELSPARNALAREIGERIGRDGGVAVIVDYGAWVDRITGDTLQAVRGHQPVDPLDAPGEADLTTHVDFKQLGKAAASGGAAVFGPVPQGSFLRTLGIEVRSAALLRRADPEQSRSLREALFRLTDASAMGELFKVLALSAPNASPPPGFDKPTCEARREKGEPTPSQGSEIT